jgi:hypothetical protein
MPMEHAPVRLMNTTINQSAGIKIIFHFIYSRKTEVDIVDRLIEFVNERLAAAGG